MRVDGAGICVLVVEDNPSVGDFTAAALHELGYDSILATNAQDPLDELAKDCDRFHVVFSDVVMPGMSGIELARRIRRDFPKVPVVLATGYSAEVAKNGDHGFALLTKPYSIDDLSRALRKATAVTSGNGSTNLQSNREFLPLHLIADHKRKLMPSRLVSCDLKHLPIPLDVLVTNRWATFFGRLSY